MMGLPPSYEAAFHNPPSNKSRSLTSNNRAKFSEVKLFENSKERSRFEDLADLFAIMKTMESLEAASYDGGSPIMIKLIVHLQAHRVISLHVYTVYFRTRSQSL